MSRGMWILAAILAVLVISQMYMSGSGQLDRPWAECKESLMSQVISGECTPRDGSLAPPATAGGGLSTEPTQPPLDDGTQKVDRGQ
ncbi:MAG: hypothetical protein NXI18_06130 [Alphaproteobacteria bacterium]|nr:hypothetical protein [Alphaproteobacteria bacterium]